MFHTNKTDLQVIDEIDKIEKQIESLRILQRSLIRERDSRSSKKFSEEMSDFYEWRKQNEKPWERPITRF